MLILRDVLGFSASEAADSLDTTVPSVNSTASRPRRHGGARAGAEPAGDLRALGDRRLREIVERFADAFERGEIDAVLEMLSDDATFAMPPYPEWCQGREALAESWLMPSGPAPRLRYVPTRANGQLALGVYRFDDGAGGYVPIALDVLALRGDLIVDVTAFRSTEAFPRFNLPARG